MRKIIAFISLGALLLSACSVLQPTAVEPTPTQDAVATQVALLLTTMPTATAPLPTATTAPSATLPAETSTPEMETPTPTTAASSTTDTSDPRTSLGEPHWTNNLDSSEVFYLFENEGTRVTHENSALVLTGRQPNGWLGYSLTFAQQPVNFYLEGEFETQTCAGTDVYGFVFRAPDTEAGYFFGVTCDGQYYLRVINFKDGTNRPLINLTEGKGILTGSNQTNRLGVMANGEKIGLYVNGTLQQEVTDSTFTNKGYFGAFVAANQTAGFTVRLNTVSLWNLP